MRNRLTKISAAALGGVLALLLTSGGAARAATAFCSDPTLGGTFNCSNGDYSTGEAWWTFPDNSQQLFVIGTDRAVWTRWWIDSSGTWSGWTSLGGTSTNFPPVFWDGNAYYRFDGGTDTPTIVVKGTDGNPWHRTRSASGPWGGWAKGNGCSSSGGC